MTAKMNYKGKVKSVHISNGSEFIKLHFNKSGQLIKKDTKYKLFDQYVYDKQIRLISYNARVLSSGYIDYYHLEYDKNGFLISDGHISYKNDEKGNCIEEERSYGTVRRKYNSKNQISEEWWYHGEHPIIRSWYVDENGNQWEKDEEMPSESEHILYQYNERGDIVQCKIADIDNPQTDDITYEYDEKGNWTKQLHSVGSLKINSEDELSGKCITRVIEYYD